MHLKNPRTNDILKFLDLSYVKDDEVERLPLERCGWRSLVQIAKGAGIRGHSLYGKEPGEVGPEIQELLRNHLIEFRYFSGERGRGGEVMRFRILSHSSNTQQAQKTAEPPGELIHLDERRVAVLPFANIGPDLGDEYFADGMMEELISCISKIKELSVISRSSAMMFKDKLDRRTSEIGRDLKAGSLLEGSVRKAGGMVRISVQLIDAALDKNLWAETYDRKIADIFAIQSEIAENVAGALKVRLLSLEKEKMSKPSTLNMEAYTTYLKGSYRLNKHSKQAYLDAAQLFDKAIEIDPRFALAFAKLASAHAFLGLQALSADPSEFQKAEEYARKALELDESLPEAHMALAFAYVQKWDLSRAETEFKRTLEINPNFAAARAYYANTLCFSRRFEECLEQIRTCLQLDPLSAETSLWSGNAYLYSKHYDEAINQFQNALEIDPNIMMAQNNLGVAYMQKGLVERGLQEILKAVEIAGDSGFPQVANDLGNAYARLERFDDTKTILSRLFKLYEEKEASIQLAIPIAGLHAAIGENEKAIDWLEKAYETRYAYLITVNCDFNFDRLRNEPRFNSLMKKIGFELS